MLISVVLRNETNEPLSFNLRDFVLTARDGSTYGPVNIRSVTGVAAANYIPEKGRLVPHSRVEGWLTFDARTGGAPPVARRLSYIDGKQTLTIVFLGRHVVS